MPDYLSNTIHMAIVGDDVVVLDTANDAYICLVGGAGFVRLGPQCAIEIDGDAARATLAEAGFVTSTPSASRRAPPPLPSVASSLTSIQRPSLRERIAFVRTAADMLWRYQKLPFSSLIIDGDPPRALPSNGRRDGAIRAAALFAEWLPWTPAQGVCLYRAFMLRQFLRRSGADADWVFGVSTWPFSAHCWLQAGDVLLDDDVDRVRSYTPILVV